MDETLNKQKTMQILALNVTILRNSFVKLFNTLENYKRQ